LKSLYYFYVELEAVFHSFFSFHTRDYYKLSFGVTFSNIFVIIYDNLSIKLQYDQVHKS